jgi:hypothetical protein
MSGKVVVLLMAGGMVTGCGSGGSKTAQSPSQQTSSTGSTHPTSIVGRWEIRRTCQGMVQALDQVGLRQLAPSVVGDYFPNQKPKELARKANICQGAAPQQHSHFFTKDGKFGSLDQHGQQVDDGAYRVVDQHTFRLGSGVDEETYRYRIVGGTELTMEPVIPARAKRAALAKPFEFGLAGHSAAVAYTGHTWKRVDCGRWC